MLYIPVVSYTCIPSSLQKLDSPYIKDLVILYLLLFISICSISNYKNNAI